MDLIEVSAIGPVPSGWRRAKFVDVCTKIGTGATPRGGKENYLPNRCNFALIRSQNVYNDRFEETGLAFIEDQAALLLKNAKVEIGDVLLNITGDGVTFARSCLVPESILPAVVNQHVCIIRPEPNLVESRFISGFLNLPQVKIYIESFNAGGSRRAITKGNIECFNIPLPPLSEQKAIAHILGTLDDKIELNRRMNETLEAMAQALFKSWFVDFDPVLDNAIEAGNPIPDALAARAETRRQVLAQGRADRETAKLFPDAFRFTEELGWIPVGWEAEPMDQAIDINPRVSLKKGSLAPFVEMKALPTRGFCVEKIAAKAYAGGAKFQNGDVLLARITPCLENGKMGIVDFLNDDDVGFGSTEYIVFRPKAAFSTCFLACLARHEPFRHFCMQAMVGSSGRQRVQTDAFNQYFLSSDADGTALLRFNELCHPILASLRRRVDQNSVLENLRDTLLPKLISGELRVPDVEALVGSLPTKLNVGESE